MFGKIFQIVINTILTLLILLGVFVVFSFVPFPGNYKIFTVQSGSMEPTIHTGSLIFVKPMADYNVGDIVTRKTNDPKITITHRIVEKKNDDGRITFKTKGDANDGNDAEDVAKGTVIGKAIFKIPYLGYPVGFAKTTSGLIILIVIPAVIIIYDEINKIKAEIEKKIRYKKALKTKQENIKKDNDTEPVK